jgi:nucleotide-binding universal stress UspA family protein
MSYSSIMVQVDLGPNSAGRSRLASGLADMFGARLIGVAAREPAVPLMPDTGFVDEPLFEEAAARAEETLSEAERVFRDAVGLRNALGWRSALGGPTGFMLDQARAADLLVVGRQGREDHRDWMFGVQVSDVVMDAGRPVLVVPPGRESTGSRVVIAWSNTCEARRAIWDSLPFLKRAHEVYVTSVGKSAADQGVDDVIAWLGCHGVPAEARLATSPEDGPAVEILKTVDRTGADLLVVGAYGHSRAREWILGGVTRDLLQSAPVCCLMSH